ncbi:MAG: MFS transporter [Dehalococcoidia bacterium]|nr:MFS transporter [Dehalococcoidia bacterium]
MGLARALSARSDVAARLVTLRTRIVTSASITRGIEGLLNATPTAPRPARRRLYYGWRVVVAAFFATFGSVVFFNPVLGVFSQLLEDDFGWTRSEVSAAISIGGLVAGVIAPVTGILVDRWGGRWVVVLSGVIMAACALTLSQMQALWHLLLFYSIGRAVSVGAMSPAGFVATANWFVRRRAAVAGIVAVGPRIGMALFPLVVAVAIEVFGGWRAGWVALAAIALAITAPSLLFMRRRPEDMGLRPDGDPEPMDLDGLPSAPLERDFTLREAMRTRAYWLVGFAVALTMFCGGAINFHQIPHLVDQGLPRTQAALVITVFSGMGAVGAIVGGMVAQRVTMRWAMAGALVGMAGAILLLMNSASLPAAMTYAVVYGSFFGVQVSLMHVVYADYFGRAALGRIQGSFGPVQMLTNAAGPFLAGVWYDRVGSYDAPFVTFAVIFLVAALGMVLSPYPPAPKTPEGIEAGKALAAGEARA